MGITGSLPLRWPIPAVSGDEMGSSDVKHVGDYPAHPKLVPSAPPPILDSSCNTSTPQSDRSETPGTLPQAPQPAISNIKHCLVTNELASEARVELCYLLNQRLWDNKEMLTRLEWMWGMQYDSLELDTEANRIYLRHDLLESLDSHRWLLLPSPEMVDKLWDRRQKSMEDPTSAKRQPHIETLYAGADTFEYRLLPLRRGLASIDRFDQPAPSSATEQTPTRHSYPFDTLPTLVSRAKPHFVICDSGAKLYHEITSGHSGLSQVVKLLWPVSERDATLMLAYMERVYGTWLRYEPHSTFASAPRVPRRLPSPDACPRLPLRRRLRPRVCLRPCFRSRFAWTTSLCSRCQNGGVDSGASSGSGGGGDRVGLGPSEALSAYMVHRRHLSLAWRSFCLESVRKHGGWAARVLNDGQLGGYADELPQTLDELCDVSILDGDAKCTGP